MSDKAPQKSPKVNADNVEPGISAMAHQKSPEVNADDVVPHHINVFTKDFNRNMVTMDGMDYRVITQMLEAYFGSFVERMEGNNVSINLPGQCGTISVSPAPGRSQILISITYQDDDPRVSEIIKSMIVFPQTPLISDAIPGILSHMVRACKGQFSNVEKKVSSFCTQSIILL